MTQAPCCWEFPVERTRCLCDGVAQLVRADMQGKDRAGNGACACSHGAGSSPATISGGIPNPAEINDRWLYAMVSLAARESRDKPTGCKAPGAKFRGLGRVVRHRPSKPLMRVRSSQPAPLSCELARPKCRAFFVVMTDWFLLLVGVVACATVCGSFGK